MEIKLMDKVLAANDAWARENRALLRERGIAMYNLIGSPGAGKTALLEKTIALLGDSARIGVIEGDLATTRDARRIQATGVPVVQINTGRGCHLSANAVHEAVRELCGENRLQVVFVENVGNLVCPSEFDLGEDGKVAVLSVTEGDDKVEKYPLIFAKAAVLVITKMSLLTHTDFKLDAVREAFRAVNRNAPVFEVDSMGGTGFEGWLGFVTKWRR
jgi:hydrogenase nickel incorporation protein HypB